MPRRRRSYSRRVPTLNQWLRRRRRLTLSGAVASVVVLLALAVLDRQGLLLHGRGDVREYDGRRFLVQRVVDGDTLVLEHADGDGAATRVRLWGIDAPELARPALQQPAERFADEARQRLRDLVEGRLVTLALQPHRLRDHYDRLLAYVELDGGGVANEVLVREGLARADDRWPHRDVVKYALLEQEARVSRAGMWGK